MTAAEICLALVRTTLATAAAACIAALVLAWLDVRSARMHRVAWLLVVVQGWLLVPWRLELETLPASEGVRPDAMPSYARAWSESALTWPRPRTAETLAPKSAWTLADLATPTVFAWLAGGAGIALLAARRYARIVRTLPLGAAPDEPVWQAEWRHAISAMSMSSWTCSVELRITDRVGPLVAFIPFSYLVLAPRQLWSALTSCERRSILRHELAHVRRRDLWKSLAVRVLALPQWFNPFAWLAVRRFDEAAEWACDELAAKGGEPLTLAKSLLRAAESCAEATSLPRAAHVLPAVPSSRSKLSRRIHRLVTPRFKEESTMRKIAVPTLLVALAAMQLVRVERVAAGDPEEARVANEVETPKSVQPRTLAPGEELAVTFSRTDGQRLEFTNLDELRSTPGASISASMDSLTLYVPVDNDGRVSFDAWFKSGAIEVGGKTFDEAGQAIHDGVLGPHDRDFTVAVDLRPLAAAPPKLAAAAAPKPRKAKRAAKPLAAAEGEPARQVEFQMQFVEDATGALADFEFPGRGGGMTVGESRAVLSALRVFHKHKLTSTESYPVIRTEMGRPASFSVGEPVKGTGAEEGADFRIVRAVTIVAHSQDRYGADDGLFVEMQGRAEGRKLKTAMHMQIGQTAIIQIPPADGDLPAHYIVVTPRWVE